MSSRTPFDPDPVEVVGENGEILECRGPHKRELLYGPDPCPDEGAVVYFIQQGTDGPIKIGFSARGESVELRRNHLQCGNPTKLRILRVVDGSRRLEANLHERFAAHRLEGEWFEPSPEVLAQILGSTDVRDAPEFGAKSGTDDA